MKTVVEFTNDGTAILTRENISLFLFIHGGIFICIRPDIWVNGIPFVPYIHGSRSDGFAYEKMMHFIGKMCKKENESKYWNQPKIEEHLRNGFFCDEKWKVYEKMVAELIMKYMTEDVYSPD